MTKKFFVTAAPLFLVLFIDSMGLGLLFPILNSIIVNPTVSFLAPTTSAFSREFLYGLIVGVFMISWFFGAAILGDLSDLAGRKKSLMICLIGAFGGYFLSALAILFKTITLLIISRIIAGFTAGSQPIAQAAIVDISDEEDKARNIGYILLAVSLGFVCGPIIGGVLSDHHLVYWFGFSTPLYFAAIISLLNAVLLAALFHETHSADGEIRIKFHRAITIFVSAFKHPYVRKLSVVMLVMMVGWSSFFTFVSVYALSTYKLDPFMVAMLLAVMGCGFSLGCGYLVSFLDRHFRLKPTTAVSYLICATSIALVLIFKNQTLFWIMAFVIGTAMAVGYSDIITIFSNQVDANEQGWVMGVTGSIMALCFGIVSLVIGLLADINIVVPFVIASICVGISAFLLMPIQLRQN